MMKLKLHKKLFYEIKNEIFKFDQGWCINVFLSILYAPFLLLFLELWLIQRIVPKRDDNLNILGKYLKFHMYLKVSYLYMNILDHLLAHGLKNLFYHCMPKFIEALSKLNNFTFISKYKFDINRGNSCTVTGALRNQISWVELSNLHSFNLMEFPV